MSKKSKKFSLKGKKKQVITAVVVVLLLILAAGAGVLVQWLQHGGSNGNGNGNNSKNNGGLNIGDNGLPVDSSPQSVIDAQNSAVKGDVDQSNKEIATSIANTSDNDEKYALYFQQGVNAENQQKWDDALGSYKQAEAIKKTWQIYSAMGRVAEAKGDKKAAADYYKKALPLVPADLPLHDYNVNLLKAKITELGG
jgi:tetratricopeptide (TPR) repeat protein